MRLSWGFILSSLYSSAAASKAGHVYIYDPVAKSTPRQPPSVSPETARLILAQRLGLSQFHSLNNPSDELIQSLNAYGGKRQRLFGENYGRQSNAHALIWIEDVEDAKAIIGDSSAWSAEFSISSPPSSSDSDRLIQDLILQAESLPNKDDPHALTYKSGVSIEAELYPLKQSDTYRINDYLNVFHAGKNDKISPSTLAFSISTLLALSKSGLKSKDSGITFPITVILMPPSTSNRKRSAYPYGTYDLPSSPIHREQPELLLSLSAPQSSTNPTTPSGVPSLQISESENTTAPLGILPVCFKSQELCTSKTHSCSGHGSCAQLLGKPDCYACVCQASVKKVDGKNKTTYWGGPACQKKDISVPFWLFAGTGVFIAFLIASAIGMMYSMGGEELPSVIGAGVSGPARK